MPKKLTAYPTKFDCPKCNALIMAAAPLSSKPRGLKKGLIVVCAYCEAICQLGSENLKLMTKKQLKALDPESKRILNITINRIRKNPFEGN